MADTLNLLGVIGTWVAVLLAIIALAGIIPAYILYRESQTDRYEALSLIDDRPHEYISKGIALLPGRRFFRSIKVPNLVEPPKLTATEEAPKLIIKRECDFLDHEGSPSLTSWINFATLLRAYGISPSRDGKLKIAGTEALLPIHRSWILLLGLVDRYGHRKDSGLFVEEPSDPEWSAFSSDALYGLSGVLERIRPGRDRICFRMHSVAHMRSMPSYIAAEDISPKNLFFLYLGYLPASDGSLYCSAVESEPKSGSDGESMFVHRSTKQNRDVFYQMKVLKPNEVPSRDRKLADEMGITLPTIRRLSLCKSILIRSENRRDAVPDHAGVLDGVQYLGLDDGEETRIWLHPSETQSMILALLRLDLNEQSFLCGHDLKTFFERLLPTRDMDYLQYMVKEGTDALQIQGEDKEEVKMAIAEVANHPEPFTDSRTWASVIAKLDLNLRKLRQKYNAPEEAEQTMAILYLIEDDFKSRMALDPRHTDPQAIFTIDIAQKVVRVPALSYLPPVDFRFDFASVFPEVRVERGESGRSLTIPLWQVMIASLHGSIKWQMWSTVFSPRHLSALHTQLNRIVYISPHDLPDHQEDMGERLRDVADACREFNSLIKKAQIIANGRKSQRVARYDEEKGEDDDYWNEDDEDDDNDDGYDNDGGDDDEEEEGAYDDGGQGDSEVSGSESMGLPTRGRQMGVRFAGVDNDQGDHRSVQPSEASPLQESPRPDDVLIDTDAPVHEYNVENRKSDCPDNSLKDTATIILSEPVALTREEQEERYLPALEQLFAASPEQNEATLTREFRKVIGPIVLMAEPLPLNSFATLLDISQASILSQINQLQSAMIEPVVSAEPINLVDVSFRDFVLDPGSQHKHRFWVDEIKTHETISMKCLELLCRAGILRENACSLKSPGYPRADINSHAIDDALPAHVQYACRYWVYHFEKGKWSIPDVSQVTDFLNDHFLHWLEVLSLMGCVVESIAMINTLRSLVNSDNPQVSSFLQDARRFILKNREAIDEAPLQLYSSAIMFLPTSSVIRSTFENHITRSFRQLPVVDLTWDNVLLSLEGHSSGRRFRNSIRTLAFSSDSTMLASGAHDGAIIWCAATGTILLKVTRVSGVRGVAFSPDCSLLALARRDGFVSIHNLEKRSQIQKFKACSAYDYGGVNAVVFSADGNFLASGASDGTITLWDGPKARQMRKFKGHSKGIIALALSPDGLLASGSYDQTARVWEFSSGNLLQTYTRFSKPVETVEFIPDGTLLMASNDGTIKIWDLKESADAQILISSDEHERDQYGPYVNPIVLSPNGKLLAMSPATTVELRDAASGKKVAVIQGRLGRTAALAVSPDNTMLAAATESTIEIWEFHGEKIMDSSHSIIKYKNRRPGRLMVFAPNGKILALADFTTIELWDPTKGTVIRTSDKFGLEINHLTFSPDSEVLAFVCEKSIKIWDLVGVDGVQNIDLGTWYGNVEQMAFSPDRERLAEASLRRIRLWDIATRSVQQILPVLDDVNYITFSSDGSLLACTLKNGMIQRWSLPIGAPLTTLTGHTEPVVRVSFSSDNKMLASASTDGTIMLWNWDTGTVLQEFHGDAGITELSFHDNDRRLGTNLEVFALDDLTIREPYKVSSLPKFGLSTNWVTRDSERLLWLPPDYRADEVISHGSRVALRLKLGGVIFIAWDS